MKKLILAATICLVAGLRSESQEYYKYEGDNCTLVFFDKVFAKYVPHITRMHNVGETLHKQFWNSPSDSPLYHPDKPIIYLTDWQDDGNGGVNAFPVTNIQIGISPLNMSFFVSPSVERYYHLFCHEQTHVVMTDKANSSDMKWRRYIGGKVPIDDSHPVSGIWSYLSSPRWYSPRWYHEGIACYLETWMCGGVGRSLAGYDDMYFRSIVQAGDRFSSVVGLESEGTTSDFQLGTNAYLYGTRFVNYLSLTHGIDSLKAFYNRTEGSSKFFAQQFKKTYGQSVRKEWQDWQEYEKKHQKQNLELISQYPTSITKAITSEALGSVSPMSYDSKRGLLYSAINQTGDFARIVSINMEGKISRLAYLDDPRLYTPSYLTLDTVNDRLIYTSQNQNYRGLRAIDLKSGKTIFKSNFRRLGNLAYDNTNDCMYALKTMNGVISLVRVDSDLKSTRVLYIFPFGTEVFDLDVSHSGQYLSATISGENGEHSLILFGLNDLETANYSYRTLVTLENCNLNGFRFSLDDSCLLGSSYYSGVSNLWSVSIESGEMNLLSNSLSGLFNPLECSKDSLFALEFERNGLKPVLLEKKVLNDANAINLMGQQVFENESEKLSSMGIARATGPTLQYREVVDSIKKYNPLKEMRFSGAYPDLTGFVDRKAWNNVTPVLGYTFRFQDPVALSVVSLAVGISPWSSNDWKNKFHLDANWDYRFWHFDASWNHCDFYDLFGPSRASRTGYCLKAAYIRRTKLLPPMEMKWGARAAAYGMMDALPSAQEIVVDGDIRSMQTISAFGSIRKTRKSLGGVKDEQGWEIGTDNQISLAGGQLYPFVSVTANGGVLLPVLRNTSLWLRNTAGVNFIDDGSIFSRSYFGGFQRNWVDRKEQAHTSGLYNWNTMPGARIDQIAASRFLRSSLELDLQPIRFRNAGFLCFYPTYAQFSPFAGILLSGMENKSSSYFNYGLKFSVEMVLFNYLKTTWSAGWARAHGMGNNPVFDRSDEFLFSITLY